MKSMEAKYNKNVPVRARVRELLPDARFEVELENGRTALVHFSTAAKIRLVRIVPGDEVCIQLSSHDTTRGRIVVKD